ncbi:MAG: hypothetical protein WCA46_05650 [Actinocatenispora sp.]
MDDTTYYGPAGAGWRHTNTGTSISEGQLDTVTTRHERGGQVIVVHTFVRNTGVRMVRMNAGAEDQDLRIWPAQQDLTLHDAATNALLSAYEEHQRAAQHRGPGDAVTVSKERINELATLGHHLGSGSWQPATLSLGTQRLDAQRLTLNEGWVIVAIDPATGAPVAIGATRGVDPDVSLTAMGRPPTTS